MKVDKDEIKRLREAIPLNVADMAKKLRLTPQTVHRIERTGIAGWKSVKKLARVHNLEDVKQILAKPEEPK